MDDWEREELLIRMDERIKTIYNRMDKFETSFYESPTPPRNVGERY